MKDSLKKILETYKQSHLLRFENCVSEAENAALEAELEKKKAADEVKTEMISIAALMAGKVVAASIDTTVQNQLIEETLKEMGEGTWLN